MHATSVEIISKYKLLLKLTPYEKDFVFLSRYGWLDEVSDPIMHKKLIALSDRDKEIITLRMDGFSQAEIGVKMGISQWAVSKRMIKIKKLLRNF